MQVRPRDLSPEAVDLRLMTEADVLLADELRRIVGWNQRPTDWQRLLALEPKGCFVAVAGGNLIGTVTTTIYGTILAWIGMMLVHPEHRRKGIATRLMKRALEYLKERNVKCAKLDATPAGQPVYTRLGFIPEWTLQRWHREFRSPISTEPPISPQTRKLREEDWAQVIRIDAEAFGAPRPEVLRRLAQESRYKLVWPAEGTVLGFGMVRTGATSNYLGPLVCAQGAGFNMLLSNFLAVEHDQGVTWDIPDHNQSAKSAAIHYGFKPVRPLIRMRLGSAADAINPETLFGIADPAVG